LKAVSPSRISLRASDRSSAVGFIGIRFAVVTNSSSVIGGGAIAVSMSPMPSAVIVRIMNWFLDLELEA
jgi:hypothetical protein